MNIAIIGYGFLNEELIKRTIRKIEENKIIVFNKKIRYKKYSSGVEFLNESKEISYDFIVIDINMCDMDGIDLAYKCLELDKNSKTILVSNDIKRAKEGYLVGAYRYIEYDFFDEEFSEAILSYITKNSNRIELHVVGLGNIDVDINTINYIVTSKRNVVISTDRDKFTCKNTLKEIYNKLDKKFFFKVNQSTIVNLKDAIRIEKEILIMRNGEQLDISPRKYLKIKKAHLMNIID